MAEAKDGLCLHCSIVAALEAHYEGETHVDAFHVLSQLGQVAAEWIASHPEKAVRDRMVRQFTRAVRDEVPKARASGNHPGFARLH